MIRRSFASDKAGYDYQMAGLKYYYYHHLAALRLALR